MRSLFAKIVVLACLALVLGLKVLTLLNASEPLFLHPHRHRATNQLSLTTHALTHNGPDKHAALSPKKVKANQSFVFEEDTKSDLKLKKEIRDELHKLFSSFAKFELSSRILAFHKSYSVSLSVSEHHSPLYVLDHSLLI